MKKFGSIIRAILAIVLSVTMVLGLAACAGEKTPPPVGTDQKTPNSGTDGNSPTSPEQPVLKEPPGKNTDNSFSMIATWTSSGLINHFDSKTSCDVFQYFVVEGLWSYVRKSDEMYCMEAAELPIHSVENMDDYADVIGDDMVAYLKGLGFTTVPVSTGKIRPNAKWANGEDLIAKDVWAYYYIMHPTTTNYLVGIKVVDDKTIQFIWNPEKEPLGNAKNILLATDKCCTVKYDLFAQYADALHDLVMKGKINDVPGQWGAFNRVCSPEERDELGTIRQNFQADNPSWYVSTGPFKLDTFSATQILLTKNEYYWNAENIGFDKIKLYTSRDLNQTYQMLLDGVIDYYDQIIPEDTLEQLLAQNEDLVNIKMLNTGTYGIVFNTKNEMLSDIRVREALEYVFDREMITMAANPYADVTYYPMMGMPPSMAKLNMSEQHYNELKEYSFDQEKAAEMLQAAGWEKKSGSWYANGKLVEFNMGVPNNRAVCIMAAEAAAAQLNAFGIQCNLLQSDNYTPMATEADSQYDLGCFWVDLSSSSNHPLSSYSEFNGYYSKIAHLERYSNAEEDVRLRGYPTLKVKGLDGDTNEYAFVDYYHKLYSLGEEELTYITDVFNTRIAEMCLGVPFFENIHSVTYNVGKVSGVPLMEYWLQNRNIQYVPHMGDPGFEESVSTCFSFSRSYNFINGNYQPNKPE